MKAKCARSAMLFYMTKDSALSGRCKKSPSGGVHLSLSVTVTLRLERAHRYARVYMSYDVLSILSVYQQAFELSCPSWKQATERDLRFMNYRAT